MSTSRSYAELFVPDIEAVTAARNRGVELGCPPLAPGVGTALTFLAAAVGARAVVEVGTAAGVATLHLLAGMADDGIVTSIDADGVRQRAARASLTEAGVGASRARLINGNALEVLPRLTDGAYDLVFVNSAPADYPSFLAEAKRLLRGGGVMVFNDGLWQDKVGDPTQRDAQTVAVRETGRAMREDDVLVPLIIPLGGGLLAAVKAR